MYHNGNEMLNAVLQSGISTVPCHLNFVRSHEHAPINVREEEETFDSPVHVREEEETANEVLERVACSRGVMRFGRDDKRIRSRRIFRWPRNMLETVLANAN